MKSYWAKIEKIVNQGKGKAVNPNQFNFEFKPLFWDSAKGYQGRNEAFLAGCQVATEKRASYNVVAIIDDNAEVLFTYPGSSYFSGESGIDLKTSGVTEGKFVEVSKGEQLLALSIPSNDAQIPGKLELYALSPEQRSILTDAGHPKDQPAAEYSWGSAYYFYDYDGDGRLDVLVNRRTVETLPDGTAKHGNQKLVYKLDPPNLKARSVEMKDQGALLNLFKNVKADGKIPVVFQHGVAESLDQDLGEAIYPSEEGMRKVRYAETGLPNQAVSSSMLAVISNEPGVSSVHIPLPKNSTVATGSVNSTASISPSQWTVALLGFGLIGLLVWFGISYSRTRTNGRQT